MPLETFVHCQSGEAQDRQWISRQSSAQVLGQLLRNHLPAGDGHKPGNVVALDGDIGRADVVSKLILAGVALEEAIEVDISTAKLGSNVPGFQPPNANFELRVTHVYNQ